MDHRKRFVMRAEAGDGWRIWDKQQKRWYGPVFARQPDAVLAELNGLKRPERLVALMRSATRWIACPGGSSGRFKTIARCRRTS